MQVSMVSDYIIKLLRGQNTSITRIPSSVTASVYLALLPSIWTVINDSYPELSSHVTDVLQALLEHASQTPSKSRTKHITIEFVARLFLVSSCNLKPSSLAYQSGDYQLQLEAEVDYRGTFRAGSHHQARQLFEDWLIGLPQVLWETGTAEPMTTEVTISIPRRLSNDLMTSFSRLSYDFYCVGYSAERRWFTLRCAVV